MDIYENISFVKKTPCEDINEIEYDWLYSQVAPHCSSREIEFLLNKENMTTGVIIERLTKSVADFHKNVNFDEMENVPIEVFSPIFNRLAELGDKIEDKTLVELSCKVGDSIYIIISIWDDLTMSRKFKVIKKTVDYVDTGWQIEADGLCFNKKHIKKYYGLFLTEAEAEARLKELTKKDGEE